MEREKQSIAQARIRCVCAARVQLIETRKANNDAREDRIIAEFENIEISEELLAEIAGGTMTPNATLMAKNIAVSNKLRGNTKEERISSLLEYYRFPGTYDEIAAIVEKVFS